MIDQSVSKLLTGSDALVFQLDRVFRLERLFGCLPLSSETRLRMMSDLLVLFGFSNATCLQEKNEKHPKGRYEYFPTFRPGIGVVIKERQNRDEAKIARQCAYFDQKDRICKCEQGEFTEVGRPYCGKEATNIERRLERLGKVDKSVYVTKGYNTSIPWDLEKQGEAKIIRKLRRHLEKQGEASIDEYLSDKLRERLNLRSGINLIDVHKIIAKYGFKHLEKELIELIWQ